MPVLHAKESKEPLFKNDLIKRYASLRTVGTVAVCILIDSALLSFIRHYYINTQLFRLTGNS